MFELAFSERASFKKVDNEIRWMRGLQSCGDDVMNSQMDAICSTQNLGLERVKRIATIAHEFMKQKCSHQVRLHACKVPQLSPMTSRVLSSLGLDSNLAVD